MGRGGAACYRDRPAGRSDQENARGDKSPKPSGYRPANYALDNASWGDILCQG